jgi:hypothetical protein
MRATIVALLLIATTALADEPRINRISAEKKEEARAALMRAVNERAVADDWGFVLAADTETDPDRKKIAQSMGDAESRVPIANAVFRRGGEKKLGPHVARLLTAPALPVIRDPTEDEIWYEWMLVAYDLEEPIFVIQVGKTRVLVNLDEHHKIDWVDLLPDSL